MVSREMLSQKGEGIDARENAEEVNYNRDDSFLLGVVCVLGCGVVFRARRLHHEDLGEHVIHRSRFGEADRGEEQGGENEELHAFAWT